jgi:hypothetical protein
VARHALAQACALAPLGPGGWLAAGGADGLLLAETGPAQAVRGSGLRLDNHWWALPA